MWCIGRQVNKKRGLASSFATNGNIGSMNGRACYEGEGYVGTKSIAAAQATRVDLHCKSTVTGSYRNCQLLLTCVWHTAKLQTFTNSNGLSSGGKPSR